jgi:long-chain fatty acid transport protein
MPRHLARFALASLLACTLAAPASASPLLELIGGTSGGGFNARVVGSGPEATYFNPALLAGQVESFDVVLFGMGNTLSINAYERPDGVDLAPSIYDAWLGDGMGGITPLPNPPLATRDLAPRQGDSGLTGFKSYIGFGAIKHIVGQKLVFGFYGALPTSQIQGHNVFYADEREQYFSNSLRFELYDDRLTMPSFVFALGSRVSELLSVGVGFVGVIDTVASTPVYVPDGADLGSVYLGQSLTVDAKAAPHFGAELRPGRGVRVTASAHTPSSVEVQGSNRIRLPNGTIALQEFRFTHGYQPLAVALGGAWDTLDCPGRRVTVVGSAVWRHWQSYKDRHSEQPLDPWNNTLSLSVGGRYRTGETEFFADATYVPSPVPDQTGRQNYVDNTRLGLLAGIKGHTRMLGSRVSGGFFLQGHRLLERSVEKDLDAANPVFDEFPDNAVNPTVDPRAFLPEAQGLQTNNPGYPGFSSSGFVIAAGVSMRMNF